MNWTTELESESHDSSKRVESQSNIGFHFISGVLPSEEATCLCLGHSCD